MPTASLTYQDNLQTNMSIRFRKKEEKKSATFFQVNIRVWSSFNIIIETTSYVILINDPGIRGLTSQKVKVDLKSYRFVRFFLNLLFLSELFSTLNYYIYAGGGASNLCPTKNGS